jgi:hypothetical protein
MLGKTSLLLPRTRWSGVPNSTIKPEKDYTVDIRKYTLQTNSNIGKKMKVVEGWADESVKFDTISFT